MRWGVAEGRRLDALRREAKVNQQVLAADTGVPIATLQRILAGRADPGDDRLAAICARLDVPVTRVLAADEDAPDGLVAVDMYDVDVAAGAGREPFGEQVSDTWPFPRDWLNRHTSPGSRLAMVRVVGDSQYPDFRTGDMVVVDLADNRLRDGLAVVRRDGRLMLKRLAVEGPIVRLTSANPAYGDVLVPIDEDGFAVIGMAAMAVKLL